MHTDQSQQTQTEEEVRDNVQRETFENHFEIGIRPEHLEHIKHSSSVQIELTFFAFENFNIFSFSCAVC